MIGESKILNIKKLKITCKKCETQVILKLGETAYRCPVCGAGFLPGVDNVFLKLSQTLSELAECDAAGFSFICDDEKESK